MEEEARRFQREVIKDVIEGLRATFSSENIQEDILERLKRVWEDKLIEKSQPRNG